jgi:cell division transport system ATP-binding protein
MIVFEHVTKRFGETSALDDVSFVIDPGEFVYLLGASGAGKTTLGNLLIHVSKASSGTIQVGDFNLTNIRLRDIPLLRQQIGVVFQDYKLLPDRTAAENIALSLEILNQHEAQIQKTVQELLAVVGLADKGKLFPRQLSGGETQRVVIARALATDPAVLFADEPTGNLDEKTGAQIVDLLHRINKHGTTVIMATHDTRIPGARSSRILMLEQGKLITDSRPKELPKQESDPGIDTAPIAEAA